MHELEPYYSWRDKYIAEEDERSPMYGRVYDEFSYSQKIYNYFIHPQWDNFGSATLYMKILIVDYLNEFAVIELIGEWNDCINNDIMHLKRNIIDKMQKEGIYKFILVGENVLNFHCSDDCYYEEWKEEVMEQDGWITMLNVQDHVMDEMNELNLGYYFHFGETFNDINWRTLEPLHLMYAVENTFVRLLQ